MKRVMEKNSIRTWSAAIKKIEPTARNAGLWSEALDLISVPRRSRIEVNLNKLNRLAKNDEFVVVPGKILAFGSVNHKFNVAAVEYSRAAVKKLKDKGCGIIELEQMLKKENLRIIK
jgi:large subunit ribosomal protein L18e